MMTRTKYKIEINEESAIVTHYLQNRDLPSASTYAEEAFSILNRDLVSELRHVESNFLNLMINK